MGDLAIDDVSVRSGSCQGHTVSPTISTTTIFSPPVTSESPPSSQAPSPTEQSTSSPSTNRPSLSSALPSSAFSGIVFMPSFLPKEKHLALVVDRTRLK